jgi:dipeptidyl aminopeptidase/acylaminoacyl peptidase
MGTWHLAELNTRTKKLEVIDTPYSEISYLKANADYAVFIGGSPREHASVVLLDLNLKNTIVLKKSSDMVIESSYISSPDAVEFPTSHGLTAHAFFYAPKNRDYSPPPNEKPPLIVISHGGPTSATTTSFNLAIQYWTSRGIAVLDVNYGGSTGYGRNYRDRLLGQWGVADVDDCVNGAFHLVALDKVDAKKLIIRGGSAGGFTTLNALTFRDIFSAGASYYGVSDLEALRVETHKFESRDLERLIGSYPENKDLYRSRSPINFVDLLSSPVIFFQGLEDKIVPPDQAQKMFEALRSRGIPVSYLQFEGEQHGFRKAENIKSSLDAELYFYSRVFGFELADFVMPIYIENYSKEKQ